MTTLSFKTACIMVIIKVVWTSQKYLSLTVVDVFAVGVVVFVWKQKWKNP